jgi:hypothetical protein
MEPNVSKSAARETVLLACRNMLSGQLDLIKGCRIVVSNHRLLDIADDPAIIALVGIESETDDFPDEFDNWETEAAKRVLAEKSRYLERVKDVLLESCAEIIRKLEGSAGSA